MMRNLFLVSTASFWLLVGGFWLLSVLAPSLETQTPADAPRAYSLAQVAAHNSPADCWMAIHGKVYDLSAYLPKHPSRPDLIEIWCGKDASDAYATKTRGRSHSAAADQLLQQYFIAGQK